MSTEKQVKEEKKSKQVESQQSWSTEMGKDSKMHTSDVEMGKGSQMHTAEMGKGQVCHPDVEMGKGSKMHTAEMGKGSQMHTGEMGKGYQMSGTTEMGPGCVPTTEMGKGQMHTSEMGKGSQMHTSDVEMGKGYQMSGTTEMGPGCVPQSHTTEMGKECMHEMGPGYYVPQTHPSELEKSKEMHEMGPGYYVPVPQTHTSEMGSGYGSQMHTSEMNPGYVPQTHTTEMGKGMHSQVTPTTTGGLLYSIRNDHTLFRSNIDSLLNITDLKTKVGIFNETIKKCSQYDVAEEVVLYSTIKNLGLSRVADTALEQTKHFEKLLYDMDHKYGGGITDNNCFNEDLTRLRDALNLHITLEENEIFPSLESYLSSDDIESINKWFDRIKIMAPTRPHPSGPHSTAGKLLTGPVLSFVDRFRDLGKQFTKTP